MSSIDSSLQALFGKLEEFVTTKTVVGEPIHIGDVILLPLVDVTFGVGAGVLGNSKNDEDKESGGGGLGAKITPSAVLVICDGNVQLVNVKNQDSLNKIIDMAPGVLNKLNLGSLFGGKTSKQAEAENI